MKLSLLFTTTAVALVVICLGSAAHASKPKEPAAPPDLRKLIKSVDAKASTVTIVNNRDKSTHTYKVDDQTTVMVNNQPVKFPEIKPGMVVDDFVERDSDDLDSVSLTGYGTEPVVKSKKSEKPKPTPPQ